MIIDDRNINIKEANRVSFLYKTKFVLYTLLTMVAVALVVLNCLGPFKMMKKLKIVEW